MKIRIRAASLLGLHHPQPPSLTGLADAMQITRFQLMHFLDDSSPLISRHTLEAVCKYLLEHRQVQVDDMFHKLFGIEPASLWPILAGRQQINFSVGVRKTDAIGYEHFVIAADAALQSVMVHQLMGAGVFTRADNMVEERDPRQVIDTQLILSWRAPGVSEAAIKSEATAYFRRCVRGQSNTATVCVGSIKSNPACDPFIAHSFRRAKTFRSEDTIQRLDDRSCPFVMIYRKSDPHPPSCWAGQKLAKDDTRTAPGIYYTCQPGVWECAPCGELEDAALVFYYFHKSRQNAIAVCGGYTGRSTRCLAEMLRKGEADKFWPPAVDDRRVTAGAFIVRFAFKPRRKNEGLQVRPRQLRAKPEVIALPAEILAPRLAK